jgi:hypothetical protein
LSSFWDNYKEVGGNFVSGDEKKVLVENGIPFDVTQVTKRESGKFGPEYALSVLVPNAETGEPEERTMTFQYGTVGSRDSMLAQMEVYLDSEGASPVTCKLEMGGRAVLIRKAE